MYRLSAAPASAIHDLRTLRVVPRVEIVRQLGLGGRAPQRDGEGRAAGGQQFLGRRGGHHGGVAVAGHARNRPRVVHHRIDQRQPPHPRRAGRQQVLGDGAADVVPGHGERLPRAQLGREPAHPSGRAAACRDDAPA
ncbi:hypothetical protein [Nonomuraea diastatica]|uniref:Uncharacterized protein n=1 Tax=Nonomuraea diastatica TaxID=1848329 RepID=A0A4R4VRB3_9ACTN|nr:hypothetical protein [Nonomuraea diastatica]TDD05723.1 hypothetical protein E1294_49375 [Nonomuraea diastatica]